MAWLALACGAVAGPLIHLAAPQWSVLLGGLIGGTVAWGLRRTKRACLSSRCSSWPAAVATYLWRGLGMLISGRVSMDSEFFVWAGCVAYAMIAGLTVRILLLPTGTLAATPLPERLVACALALVVYFVFRRNLFVGIATGFVGA